MGSHGDMALLSSHATEGTHCPSTGPSKGTLLASDGVSICPASCLESLMLEKEEGWEAQAYWVSPWFCDMLPSGSWVRYGKALGDPRNRLEINHITEGGEACEPIYSNIGLSED